MAGNEPLNGGLIEAALKRAWMRRGLPALALRPFSWLFGTLAATRRALYRLGWLRSTRLAVPVVVVGNIFVGGTGKTPLTLWLVDALRQAGFNPGVISRGHGARSRSPRAVNAASLARDCGDEPLLIAQRTGCPVFVGRDRPAAGQALLAAHPAVDVLISDDGLQHYALQRDIEIVLFDDRGTGNGWLLPAGPLREPASRRRDFTVVNGTSWPARIGPATQPGVARMQLHGEWAERLSDRTERLALHGLSHARLSESSENSRQPSRALHIVAAAGIGNPERFFSLLRAKGVIFDPMPLADHYDFARNPFDGVQADLILMTEKDAVKCAQIDALKNDRRLWVVPVAARIDAALAELIVEKCRGFPIT